jgi:uncharacterized membrane protein YbhN (UPF0104 family)
MHNPPPSTVKPLIFGSRGHGYIALAVNAAFLALLFYWLSQNVNFSDLRKYLQQIPTSAIIVGMAMNVAVLMCFGARLAAILDAKIFPCFLITITGMTFNSLLPFRLGEGVKLYCGGAFFRLPVGGLGAAIVMEKLYDLLMLLLLLATLIANAHLPFVNIGSPQILGLAVAAPLCGLLIFRARGAGIKVLSRLAILERFGLNSIVEQAGILFTRQKVVFPAFLTLLIWSVNVSLVLFFFRAVAPEIHFGVLDAMALVVIASLAIAAPVSPAGLGVFEAGIAAYLINFHGLQTEKAISADALYHFVISLPHSAITAAFFTSMFLFRKRT